MCGRGCEIVVWFGSIVVADELITREEGFVVWLTGLPCAGKSTIAKALAKDISGKSQRVEVLDGDAMRQVLSPELGFSREHREIHLRRVAFVAELLSRNGVVAIVATLSPYRAIREELRATITSRFIEVYVACALEVCERRDVKGLYAKARAGLLSDLTGLGDPYEPPDHPEIRVDTDRESVSDSVTKIIRFLEEAVWAGGESFGDRSSHRFYAPSASPEEHGSKTTEAG